MVTGSMIDRSHLDSVGLGERLADGLQARSTAPGFPGARTASARAPARRSAPSCHATPRRRAVAYPELPDVAWHHLANRGVWEAIEGSGPTCSVAATEVDVDRYVEAYGALLAELAA